MKLSIATSVAALLALTASAGAQVAQPPAAPTTFDDAAYITCREAHMMPPEARKQLALMLAEHAARHRGVLVPDDQRGRELAYLVRGGCTLAPDAYLFTVIDRAIAAEMTKLPKRQ
jgi:hypothetical protein